MELHERIEGNDVLVVQLSAPSLDASNAPAFRDAVQTLLQDRTRIVLDLSGVAFVDSSGLGALIGCHRQVSGRKGDFRLCSMSKAVRALFELMRMNRMFTIHDTPDAAVQSFA